MKSHDETSRLIQLLHELYRKVSIFAVQRRISRYRKITTPAYVLDITDPLAKQLDKLAAQSKQRAVIAADAQAGQYTPEIHNSDSAKPQPGLAAKVVDGFSLEVKLSARKNETDQSMAEKLKASTWAHLHLAFMKARNGEADAAKLHAAITSQALKDAAHYLGDDDYKMLCADVEKAVNEAHNISA